MQQLYIKNIAGTVIASMPGDNIHVSSAVISSSFMANDTLTIECTSRNALNVSVGCYIEIDDNNIYRMNQLPQGGRNGGEIGFSYTLVFESVKFDLLNVRFLLPDDAYGDVITADLSTLIGIIADNACRVYGEGTWVKGMVPGTSVISNTFSEMNCLAALQSMMGAWEQDYNLTYEFRITRTNGVNCINVMEEDGGADSGITLAYGHAGGLYSISRNAIGSENIVTRLYVYGSADNIPVGYPHNKLCLPCNDKTKQRNSSFVQDDAAIALFGLKEGNVTLNDVKPIARFVVDRVERISNSGTRSGYNIKIVSNSMDVQRPYGFCPEAVWQDTEDDYQEWLEMYGYNNVPEGSSEYVGPYTHAYFDGTVGGAATKVVGQKKYAANGTMTVTFNTGKCAGIAFEVVQGSTLAGDGSMTLITQVFNENVPGEYYMPSEAGGAWEIQVGDEFVISNILMPMSLVRRAENELLSEANYELAHKKKKNARYSVEFDQITKDSMELSGLIPGNFIHVNDAALGIDSSESIKITKVDRDLIRGNISAEISTIKIAKRSRDVNRANDGVSRVDENAVGRTALTCQFIPNYDYTEYRPNLKPYNTLYVGQGKFINQSFVGYEKEWNISERIIELQSGFKYDILVQASRKTDYATICVRKNTEIEAESIIANLPSGATVNPIRRKRANVNGSIDDSSFYLKIGEISEERFSLMGKDWVVAGDNSGAYDGVILRNGPKRSLTMIYGQFAISANDIMSGIIGGKVLLGDGATVVDTDGVSINVSSRLEADRNNVTLLNTTLSNIKNSLHSVVQTMKSAKVTISGSEHTVGYNWSSCDDTKCAVIQNPDKLIPKVPTLK